MKNKNDFNIMITSNGFLNGTRTKQIDEIYKQIATNKKILFVANAAPKESGNYIARTVVKENFEKIGAKQVTVLDIDAGKFNHITRILQLAIFLQWSMAIIF